MMTHLDDDICPPELDGLVLQTLQGLREPVQCMDVYRVLRDDLYGLVCSSVSALVARGDVVRTPWGYVAAGCDKGDAANRHVPPDDVEQPPAAKPTVSQPVAQPRQPAEPVPAADAASMSVAADKGEHADEAGHDIPIEPSPEAEPEVVGRLSASPAAPDPAPRVETARPEAPTGPDPSDSGGPAALATQHTGGLLEQLTSVHACVSALFGQKLTLPLRAQQSAGMLDVSRQALEFLAHCNIATVGELVTNLDMLDRDALADEAVLKELADTLARHAKPLPAWMDESAMGLAVLAGSECFAFNHFGVLVSFSNAQMQRLCEALKLACLYDAQGRDVSLASLSLPTRIVMKLRAKDADALSRIVTLTRPQLEDMGLSSVDIDRICVALSKRCAHPLRLGMDAVAVRDARLARQVGSRAPGEMPVHILTRSCSAQARQAVADLLEGGELARLAGSIAPLVEDDSFAVVYAPYVDARLQRRYSVPSIKKLISSDLMVGLEANDACLSQLAQQCAEAAGASSPGRVTVDTHAFWSRAAQRLARSSRYLTYEPRALVVSPVPLGEQASTVQTAASSEARATQVKEELSELDYDVLIGGQANSESADLGASAQKSATPDASGLLPGEPVDPANVFAARMTVPEWLATRPADEQANLSVQLENEYSTDISKRLHCTVMEAVSARNKARQLFRSQACFREDDFAYLYKTYDVSPEMFEWLTGLGELSYGYLRLLYDRGHKQITYTIVIDKRLSEQVRERAKLKLQATGTDRLSGASASPAQREFFAGQFTGVRYVSLDVLKARYEDRFGAGSAKDVTERLLDSLGYKVSEALVMPGATDVSELMGKLLDERDRFSLTELGEAVTANRQFKRDFEERLKRFAIVKTADDWYVTSQSLEQGCGVTVSMLSSYLIGAYSFASTGEPFTNRSLRHAGFQSKLDDLRDEAGLEDAFFDGILYAGVLQGLLRSSKIRGVRVYLKGAGEDVTFESLVTFLVRKRGPQEVYDLRKTLDEEYGIQMREPDLRSRVNNQTGLYFNESLDTVYLSREQSVQASRDIMSGKSETGA